MPLIGEFSIENDCGWINVHYRGSAIRRIDLSEETCRRIINEINEGIGEIDESLSESNRTIKRNLQRTMEANLRGSIFE